MRDDYDISKQLDKAYDMIGLTKHNWTDPHVGCLLKSSILTAMPLHLLFWGCESWAIKDFYLYYTWNKNDTSQRQTTHKQQDVCTVL